MSESRTKGIGGEQNKLAQIADEGDERRADAAGVGITLAAPNEVMREILTISRYDKLFLVKDSVAESVK